MANDTLKTASVLAFERKLDPSDALFFAGAWEAIVFAFVSRSSIGTLPLTQSAVTDKLGVSREYASFAVPLGATTKMDGCAAIYPALAAITVAQLFDIQLATCKLEGYLDNREAAGS